MCSVKSKPQIRQIIYSLHTEENPTKSTCKALNIGNCFEISVGIFMLNNKQKTLLLLEINDNLQRFSLENYFYFEKNRHNRFQNSKMPSP
jgi:hypothetical protein